MENKETSIAVDVIKFGLSLVVGIGCEALCSGAAGKIVSSNEMSRAERICTGMASAVVGGMVAEKADDYISRKVDNVITKTKMIVGFFKSLHDNPEPETKE